MFPFQFLAILSSILFIYYVLVSWRRSFFDLNPASCYGDTQIENYFCKHRQQRCGDSVLNLKYPFRFNDDPSLCSYPEFNLSCQHNRTILYPNQYPEEFYYVQSIDYEMHTIRVIDPGVEKDNCSTLPRYSSHGFIEGYQPFLEIQTNQFFGAVVLNAYSEYRLVFVSCKSPVRSESKLKFHRLVDTASCNYSAAPFANHNNFSQVSNKIDYHSSSSYNYVLVGRNLLVSDIEESCTINRVFTAQIDDESLLNETGHDVSFQDIQNLFAVGFQLYYSMYPIPQNALRKSIGCHIVSILRKLQVINISIQDSFSFGGLVVIGIKALVTVSIARTTIGTLLLMAFLIYKWHRRHLSMYDSIEEFLQASNGLMPIRYSYREIKSMTHNFKEKLGEGGYGLVYKGKLRSGSSVAVKMLNKSKANGQEFMNEVATIGRIHHVNVVRLVGFCLTASKRALVYDYMPNGSLDKFNFSANPNAGSLSWKKAYEIAVGVARGIAYLHQGCNMQILHFDIKPHNILLDDNFVPKVSDFGLAKLYPVQDGYVATLTAIRGTLGYMAPELFYKKIGRVSNKADVYSFGMLLMDMAGRWRNVNRSEEHSSQVYFTSWIYDKFEQGVEIEIGDHVTDEDKGISKKLILIGLWCIQMTPTDRPSMREVIEMLEGDLERLQLPPKPLFHPSDSPVHMQSCPRSSQESTESLSITLEIE